jgi:outer membrane protein OmpA-like peptidoglycan-associated protein
MTAGYSGTKKRVVKSLHQLLALNGELAERDRLIAGLEEELRELDAQLGGASAERVTLVRRLEHQKRVREQFALVASMFTPEEAQILRDGDQLIIRLVGLSFASNSSKIDPESAILMNKVEDAIDIFPRCELMIEGHTDSQGKAERNLELSISRAQSVMNFMNEEMRIPIYRMRASGYGDTRPISNNKTVEGRAKNRRIDLIIIPNIDNL